LETNRKQRIRTVPVVEVDAVAEVEMVRWPHDDERRRDLALRGLPRLLLVDAASPAPRCEDALEDWVRLPVDDDDLAARVATLHRRAGSVPGAKPVIDNDGVVRLANRWVALPPVEARIMAALVDRCGAVVQREQLAAAGWPAGAPGRNALDVHVLRLRRRVAPVGLAIRTIRSRGYLLEPVADGVPPLRNTRVT
jgi:hypothetical protein